MTASLSVYVEPKVVMTQRGRRRSMLLIACPFCRELHLHSAPVTAGEVERNALCGGGSYRLLVT